MGLVINSSAFEDGMSIPRKYTGEGDDISPPLKWTCVPEGTESFAIINDDPDAPSNTWVHWLIYNIPSQLQELPEGMPKVSELADGTKQGINDFNEIGYDGPMPPRGFEHRYFFKLYALDSVLDLPSGSTKVKLVNALKGHILDKAELVGFYKR